MSVIANIFSAIGTFFLIYSTFSKKKDKMVWMQVLDSGFNSLGCLFIGSYSGAMTNFISMVRNMIDVKGRMTNVLSYIIALVCLILGLLVNINGIVGLLPPIASVEYTILLARCKTAQSLRFALAINIALWLIHDVYVRLYPAIFADIIVLIFTLYNIVRLKAKDNF